MDSNRWWRSYFYNLKTNKIRIYTTHESLPSNSVYALVKGADGKLWISTDKGLALMNHGKIVNLNLFKGLEREYKRMSVVCTSDGKIMFGSSDGVVSLASAFAKGLNYSAPLRIRGIEVEGVEPSEFGSSISMICCKQAIYNYLITRIHLRFHLRASIINISTTFNISIT